MADSFFDSAFLAFALAKLPGVGRRRLRRLLAAAAGQRVQSVPELVALVRDVSSALRMKPPSMEAAARALEHARRLVDVCLERKWHAWVIGEPGYPSPLLRLTDPPPLLFVSGPSRLPAVPRIAIVGTREATGWGERMAASCAQAVVAAHGLVVSGLALGIDTAAHRAVVNAGGQTWAMLPGALDYVFPESNRALAECIVDLGGGLVSEYLPETRPQPSYFVERDRLQAALSDVLLVIETGRTGGTQHTIRFASSLDVPLWVTLPPDLVSRRDMSSDLVPAVQQGTWDLWTNGTASPVFPIDVENWVRGHHPAGVKNGGM